MSSLPYIMVFYRTNVGEPRINKKGKKKKYLSKVSIRTHGLWQQ